MAKAEAKAKTVKEKVQVPQEHPAYEKIKVTCSCGHSFETRSTLCRDFHVEVCSQCHPFYTGKQKFIDTAGRIDKFNSRYKKQPSTAAAASETK